MDRNWEHFKVLFSYRTTCKFLLVKAVKIVKRLNQNLRFLHSNLASFCLDSYKYLWKEKLAWLGSMKESGIVWYQPPNLDLIFLCWVRYAQLKVVQDEICSWDLPQADLFHHLLMLFSHLNPELSQFFLFLVISTATRTLIIEVCREALRVLEQLVSFLRLLVELLTLNLAKRFFANIRTQLF